MTKHITETVSAISGEPIAWSRDERDVCEKSTLGCSIRHTKPDTECEPW